MSRKGCPNKYSKKIVFHCKTCRNEWKDYPCRIGRKNFCSQSCAAISRIESLRQRSFGNTWGSLKKVTLEFREKISKAHKGKERPNIGISNGRTLCKLCHVKTPTWGFKIKEQK